jgi:hypothetical protein
MDRRVACRYPAAIKVLVLSMIDSGSLVDHSVELENISIRGCLLRSRRDHGLQPGERVWLKAMGSITTPVMDGIVVSAVKPFLGYCSIRVRFVAPLSYHTFKMLVYGTEGIDANDNSRSCPAQEQEQDQIWR